MTRPVCRDLTVVIPTTGGAVLEGCLSSIAAGSTWPQELVVVDQGRRPEVAAWVAELRARGLDARHLPSGQRGIAAATNRGLEQVRTRFVAVTHDDCRVRSDWLVRLAERLPTIGDAVPTSQPSTTLRSSTPTSCSLPTWRSRSGCSGGWGPSTSTGRC